MTFIYELDPYSLEIHRMCKNVKAVESYRLTDIEITNRQVTRDQFRSRDKDGGHTDGFAIPVNQMLHVHLMPLSFIEPELWAIEVYIAGKRHFRYLCSCDLDLDPVTFVYEQDPYSLDWLIEQGLTSRQTHYRSYRGRFLYVIWPNQQCQSTEWNQLVLQIRPESHQDHSTMLR